MPRLFIIAGCNGSGKTTASYSLLPEMLECSQFVNSDEFAKSFSPFDPSQATFSAGRFMLLKIRYLIDRKEDFCIETTLATRTLLKTIELAQSVGYEVTILYFWLNSPEIAINRVRGRVQSGGHDIPEQILRRRYKMGLEYLFKDYIPVCDNWILVDNSKFPFQVIAEGNHFGTHVTDTNKYEVVWSEAHPAEDEIDI